MFSALLFLIVIGCILYLVLYGLWIFLIAPQFGFDKRGRDHFDDKGLQDPEIEKLLLSEFKYFQQLPSDSKPKFIARVIEFMNTQEFIGKENVTITNEMKILISASAIQLTFGLKKHTFENFTKIILYPNEYLSKLDHKYHLGEVNLAGAIVLSWEDFKVGYFKENNNYNVGLHEMAHALRFDKFKSAEYDDFFDGYFDKFLAVGREEFLKARAGESIFLRKYAGTNNEEFFSVCVEYFFESPLQMREKLPELYRNLCILLNQDPSALYTSGPQLRASLFKMSFTELGENYFSSSLTYPLTVIPFIGIFFLLFFMFRSGFSFFGFLSVALIAAGGFTLSTQFKKFKIYKNGFVVTYPLNPALKSIVLTYDRIISAALNRNEYQDRLGFTHFTDTFTLTYTDGFHIESQEFLINTISGDQMEKVCAYLKREKVMIKIIGKKWTHEAVKEMEKQLI